MKKTAQFTKQMTFGEALAKNKDVLKVLKKFGMDCISCSGMSVESLETGAINHGLDPDEFLKAMNELK